MGCIPLHFGQRQPYCWLVNRIKSVRTQHCCSAFNTRAFVLPHFHFAHTSYCHTAFRLQRPSPQSWQESRETYSVFREFAGSGIFVPQIARNVCISKDSWQVFRYTYAFSRKTIDSEYVERKTCHERLPFDEKEAERIRFAGNLPFCRGNGRGRFRSAPPHTLRNLNPTLLRTAL